MKQKAQHQSTILFTSVWQARFERPAGLFWPTGHGLPKSGIKSPDSQMSIMYRTMQ